MPPPCGRRGPRFLGGLEVSRGCGARRHRSPAPVPRRSTEPVPRRSTGATASTRATGAHQSRTGPTQPAPPDPETPAIRSEQTGAENDGDSQVGNETGLEDLGPPHEIRNDQLTNDGNGGRQSWLITFGCDEPAYPMSDIGLARGRCAPPSNPRPAGVPRAARSRQQRASPSHRRRLDASEARSLRAGPRQRLRHPPLRSGPAGDGDRRSGIPACTAGLGSSRDLD